MPWPLTFITEEEFKNHVVATIEKYGEKLDVLKYISKEYPPTYLFSSKGDFLVEECKPMAELLRSRGVECAYKVYGTEETGHVFHVDIRNGFSSGANSEQLDFFKKLMEE